MIFLREVNGNFGDLPFISYLQIYNFMTCRVSYDLHVFFLTAEVALVSFGLDGQEVDHLSQAELK